MKFERSWIIKVSKGTTRLRQVLENVQKAKGKARPDSLSESVYTVLEEYLLKVVPDVEQYKFSDKLILRDSINVMDLSSMSVEMRSLVIRAVMEHVINKMDNVIVIIPEAWEYLPQGHNTPVKWFAETYIRKGAAIKDFLFVDSQDIAGIDKTPLRQCDNWILGRQKETHEVERVRDILGKKISEEEIKSLQTGFFFAYVGDQLKKVYVLPAGVPEEIGRKVAFGELSSDYVQSHFLSKNKEDDDEVFKEKYEEAMKEIKDLKEKIVALSKIADQTGKLLSESETHEASVRELNAFVDKLKAKKDEEIANLQKKLEAYEGLGEALRLLVGVSLPNIPVESERSSNVELDHAEVTYTIKDTSKAVVMDTDKIVGKVLFVALKDLPKDGWTEKDLSEKMLERGWNIGHSTLAPTLGSFVKDGKIIRIEDTKPTKYRFPSNVKFNVENEQKLSTLDCLEYGSGKQ